MSNRFIPKEEGSSSKAYHIGKPRNQRWLSMFDKKDDTRIDLVETFDINQDYDNFQQSRLSHFKPEILYSKDSWWNNTNKYVSRCVEESICVGDGDSRILLPILSQQQCQQLATKHRYMHIGMIMVGLKGMTQRHLGTKSLVIIYDDSIPIEEKKPLVYMEVDMSLNRGLFYCAPDQLIETKDVHNIKVGIQTKGYGPIRRNNLIVTLGFLGKAAKSTNINYKCHVAGVIEGLASKGVQFIKAEQFDSSIWNGQSWNLKEILTPEESVQEPTEGALFHGNNSLEICFGKYKKKALREEPEIIGDDQGGIL